MSVALLLLATGQRYRNYVDQFLNSAAEHFIPHDVILWTDGIVPHDRPVAQAFHKEPLGTPHETLYRYKTFLGKRELLESYDYLFYSDVDMRFLKDVEYSEVLTDGLVGCLHPRFAGKEGIPERDPKSTAYIPEGAGNRYFCGGFQGGETGAFLQAMNTMSANIDIDEERGITASMHDESHWNKYLLYHPPAIALPYTFMGVEGREVNPEMKMLALNKMLDDFRRMKVLGGNIVPPSGRYVWVRRKQFGNMPAGRAVQMREETARWYLNMGAVEEVPVEQLSHSS